MPCEFQCKFPDPITVACILPDLAYVHEAEKFAKSIYTIVKMIDLINLVACEV